VVTAPRAKLAADEKSTMFEAGGFAPLPTLGKKAAAPPPPVVQPPPPPAPPAVPSPPPVVQPPPPPPAPPPRPQTPTAAPTEVFIPPPQDPKLELVATVPDAGTMSFPLKFGDNTIGRAVDCDLCVPDSKNWLSRKHAVLRVSKERVELVDLGGMNGTFMNGAPITTATLSPGSSFSLGPHLEFTLRKT
jgi:pSer/pThr/pTyr-binding forkhead associated (FHA) protein